MNNPPDVSGLREEASCGHRSERRLPSLAERILFLSGLIAGLLGAATAHAQDGWYRQGDFAPVERVAVTLVNDLPHDRKDSPVIITPEQLPMLRGVHELRITLVDPAGAPRPTPSMRQRAQEGPHGRLGEANGRSFDYQLDDLDKDGLWDELFFTVDLKARERKTIYIYRGFQQRGWNPHRTHAAIGSYMRHLVPFWESETIGWKLWFPTDIDVFGKRAPVLMSQRLYMGNLDGYAVSYENPDYGSDIMSVDNSFGGGGIGLFEDPARPTRLSRPRFSPRAVVADNFNGDPIADVRYAFEVVVNGPLRSMVRAKTMNWDSGGGRYELEQVYTAYAGQSYATSKVRFTRFEPRNPATVFAAGIRRHGGQTLFHQQGGTVVTAGPEVIRNPDDVEAVQNDLRVAYAGSAMVIRDRYRPQYVFVPDFQGNHTFRVTPGPDHSFEYLIAAGWSEGSVLKTAEAFRDYVVATAREYNTPVRAAAVRSERAPGVQAR